MAPLSFIHRSIPLSQKGSPIFHSPLSPALFNPFHKRAPLSFIHHYCLPKSIPLLKEVLPVIQLLHLQELLFHCPQWPALLNTNPGLTLSPVLWIFSVSWSTAMLEGAHTKAGPLFCFTRWYTMVADVTVLPVPGGPCTHQAAPHVRWPGFGLSTALSQSAICAM